MASKQPNEQKNSPSLLDKLQLSLDWWSVIVALAFVLLIGVGIITSIPW